MTDTGQKTKVGLGTSLLVIGLMAAGSVAVLLWWSSRPTFRAPQSPPTPSVEQQTSDLKLAVRQYWQAPPDEREPSISKLVARAKQRKTLMARLLSADPKKFIDLSLPQGQTLSLPPDVQEHLELHTVREGTLEVVHRDYFEAKRSTTEYIIVADDGQGYELKFAGAIPPLQSGSKIKATGVELDNSIAVDTSPGENLTIVEDSTTTAASEKKVLVIYYEIPEDPQPADPNVFRGQIFTNSDSVNAYFQEASFGKVKLVGKVHPQGDVYGPYTVTPATCGSDRWQEAQQQAIDAGVDISGYDIYMYIGWGSCPYALTIGNFIRMNGMDEYIAAHEIGHALGTGHAGEWELRGEVEDPFDVMGTAPGFVRRHMNTARKDQLGWYAGGEMQEVNASGAYTIYPVEEANVSPKGLKIYAGMSGNVPEYFYLEFRRPFGQYFDNFSASDPIVNGVTIRRASDTATNQFNQFWNTWIIDATPATVYVFGDAPLAAGQSYVDAASGLQITTTEIAPDRSYARVSVTLTCSRSNPTVTPNPFSLWAKPGESKQFQLTIRNNDNPACGPSTFSVAPTNLPTGWFHTLPAPSVSILPGQTAIVNLTVVASLSTADDYYVISERATNQGAASYKGNASIGYRIDTVAPTVTITNPPDGSKLSGPATLTISAATVDSNGVSLREIFIDGVSVRRCTTGPTVPCSYDLDINAATFGAHKIRYEAKDPAGNVSSHTITIQVLGAGGNCEDANRNGRIDPGECMPFETQ